jgi:hypothetical protein
VEKSNNLDEIYWYERNEDGTYTEVSEPDESCTQDQAQICALGFYTPQSSVDDGKEILAPHKRYKP